MGRLQPCGCGYPLTPSLPFYGAQTMGAYPRRRGPKSEFNTEPSCSTTSSGPAQYSPTRPPRHLSTSPPLCHLQALPIW